MKTAVFINKLRVNAFHGVLPQERIVGGDYVVSLYVAYPFDRAMQTDNVDDTLDYGALCDLVRQEMAKPSNLLEHVAGRIVKAVFDAYPLAGNVRISITKTNPPMGADCDGAGVEVEEIREER